MGAILRQMLTFAMDLGVCGYGCVDTIFKGYKSVPEKQQIDS